MRRLLLLPLLLALSACASVQRYDAAQDVHALLIAIRDNDRAGFDAHVDKPALRRQLESRIVVEARDSRAPRELQALAILGAQPAAALAGEVLLRPSVFRAIASYYGYTASTPIPGPIGIASQLRYAGGDRVCLSRRADPCLLEFTRQGEHWKLSGYKAGLSELDLRLY